MRSEPPPVPSVAGPGGEPPFVSVAVPTRDRMELLDACLRSLVAQDYPATRYEIVVADDGSTDDTADVVARWAHADAAPAVRHLALDHRGPNAARNAALRAAEGDPVCFVDDDEELPPGWLTALVAAAHAHPWAACLGGPVRLRLEGRAPRMCDRDVLDEGAFDLGTEVREVWYLRGGNMAVRRFAVDAVGPFLEMRMLGHNESEWMARLHARHYPILYVPDAWIWHRRTAEQLRLRWLVARRFLRGIGQGRIEYVSGDPYEFGSEAGDVWAGIVHGGRTGCAMGWIRAAQAAGRIVGTAEARLRRLLGVGLGVGQAYSSRG